MLKVLYKAVMSGEKMVDKNDKNNPMTEIVTVDKGNNKGIESKLDSLELDKTDIINTTKFKRRSSLLESYIETKDGIVMPGNS